MFLFQWTSKFKQQVFINAYPVLILTWLECIAIFNQFFGFLPHYCERTDKVIWHEFLQSYCSRVLNVLLFLLVKLNQSCCSIVMIDFFS